MKSDSNELKLSPVARCPHCGRFIKRGIAYFSEHTKHCKHAPNLTWEDILRIADAELTALMNEEFARIIMGGSRDDFKIG